MEQKQEREQWNDFFPSNQELPKSQRKNISFLVPCVWECCPSLTQVLRDGNLEGVEKEPKSLIFISTFVELLRVSTSKRIELLSMNIKSFFFLYLFSQSPSIILWKLWASLQWVQWTPVQILIEHGSKIPVYFYPTCINSNGKISSLLQQSCLSGEELKGLGNNYKWILHMAVAWPLVQKSHQYWTGLTAPQRLSFGSYIE